ncbi:MAG: hypothetical protein WKH64_17280 [Chloroflexia bacterium]
MAGHDPWRIRRRYFARRLNLKVVRWFVILVGLAMTAYFFYEAYN